MKNVMVVFNYNAGRKQAIFCKKKIHKFLFNNCNEFKFVDIDEFNNFNLAEYDTIIAVGGDGTVNRVAKRIIGTDKVLGIIPCGTANLLASNLGIPLSINGALEVIQNEVVKETDVLNINENLCVLRFGIGYDSDIICKTPQTLKNKFGYFAYFIAGILFALRLKIKSYEIFLDKQARNISASCIIIANSANMYRKNISVGKNSKLDDGLFEVFILKTQNPISFFVEFIRIIFGITKSNIRAEYFQTNNLIIKNNWIVSHIDGEKNYFKEDINIKIANKKIKIIFNQNKNGK